MSKYNLVTFDKPNTDTIEIGNGYILNVDDRFLDKDNKLLIDEDDYSKVFLNGIEVNCLYIMGDVPYTPIICMSGHQVDSITGGQPVDFENIMYLPDGDASPSDKLAPNGNFTSRYSKCKGTIITDNITGEQRMWYGKGTQKIDVDRPWGKYMMVEEGAFLHPTVAKETVFKDIRHVDDYTIIKYYGIYKTSYGYIRDRTKYNMGYGLKGNISGYFKHSQNVTIEGTTDTLAGNGKVGTLTRNGDFYIYNDFVIHSNTDIQSNAAYFNIDIRPAVADGEYFEEVVYIKDYTVELNNQFYRGSFDIRNDGRLSCIKSLEPINPRQEIHYIYLETYGRVDVGLSPVIYSGDDNIAGKEGINACIINNRYQTGPYIKLNPDIHKIIYAIRTVGEEYTLSDLYIDGIKQTECTGIALHKNALMELISFNGSNTQGTLSNYKTFMIFKEKEGFEWTDAYCKDITTNGFPNSRLKVDPTIVKLNRLEETIKVGDIIATTATVLPNNAKNKAIAWRSSNTSIATVNQSGTVTAVGVGKCEITAVTYNGVIGKMYVNVQHADIVNITNKGLICWIDGRDGLSSDKSKWLDRACMNDVIITGNKDACIVKQNTVYMDNSLSSKVYGKVTGVRQANLKSYTLEIRCKIDVSKWSEWTDLLTYFGGSNWETTNSINRYQTSAVATGYTDTTGQYHTFTLTLDQLTLKSYVDGNLITTYQISESTNILKDLYLFRHTSPLESSRYNSGDIASVKVYSRALDAFEISKNHEYETAIQRGGI